MTENTEREQQAALDALAEVERRIREQASVAPVGAMEWRAHMADLCHIEAVRLTHREAHRCLDCGSSNLHEGPNDPPPWCCCEDCGSTNVGVA